MEMIFIKGTLVGTLMILGIYLLLHYLLSITLKHYTPEEIEQAEREVRGEAK
jgi:hypothetical protein